MNLVAIPKDKYENYRLDIIFDAYKWDPQFFDNNTIAKYALVITKKEHEKLKALTEKLALETVVAEEAINNNLKLAKSLKLPRKINRELKLMNDYEREKHIRLMRFDFHPTNNGWAISEVNSDVPGGFAEASLMPEIANRLFENNYWYLNFGELMVAAIVKKCKPAATIMFVHCTSYSDDRQVMQFLGDKLEKKGFRIIYGAADHLEFKNKEAYSILDNDLGKVDLIFRFTPLEWLVEIKPKCWLGYFETATASCNHPIAIFAQTKRFPLIWNELEKQGIDFSTWKQLLPKTLDVKEANALDGFIYKPANGRVGEGITILEACKDDEYQKIIKDVKKHPKKYIAQKRFTSTPLLGSDGELFHVCLGAYSIDQKAAGYYARISKTPRIDSNAADIPVLIEKE